jgi:DNA invertase Pin-like site-specific DNA recombinase
MTDRTIRAALYARVSTGRQAEKDLSIPDQIRQLESYCQAKGWTIHKTYVEPGASARDDNRPVFRELLADALLKSKPFDVVLTLTTSRFFRDATGARLWKRRLGKNGVKVLAIRQEVADDPMGDFIEGIFELIDQYESDINGFHTLRAMKENARRGWFNGSRPKFGYTVTKEEAANEDVERVGSGRQSEDG